MADDIRTETLRLKDEVVKLMEYTYGILQKFPKAERAILTESIKISTNVAVRLGVLIASYYERNDRRELLRKLYAEIKVLEILVQTAFNCRYITKQNLEAWNRKLKTIGDITVGWLRKAGL